MTTRVKIENMEASGHDIKLTFGSKLSNANHSVFHISPGESHETYIYENMELRVEEIK